MQYYMFVHRMNVNLKYAKGFFKSVYINFRVLPFKKAIKMPILVSAKTKFVSLIGRVEIDNPKFASVKIGFGTTQVTDYKYDRTVLDIKGLVCFKGKAKIGIGCKLDVAKNATLTFGKNFNVTGKTTIVCHKSVLFGNDNLISFNCIFMDSDLHSILNENGEVINENAPIITENKVWIGCNCTILKGTHIANGIIVGAGSVIRGKYLKEKTIITGNPAIIVKENITWK